MKFLFIIPFSLIICFIGCSKENEDVADCERFTDSEIIKEEDLVNMCIYIQVYRFDSKIYTSCVCCVCGKYAMAIDCEGEPLCDFYENCMEDFYENAEYLFSVAQE